VLSGQEDLMAKKRPKYEEMRDGLRIRVYTTRTEYEVLIGDEDYEDPEAEVWVFPKVGGILMWVGQAILSHKSNESKC
jgi:hypothetical protein